MARRPTEVDEILLEALSRGMTQQDAATEAGVGVRTVRRRLKNPEFREALEQRRFDVRNILQQSTRGLFAKALRTIEDILDDVQAPASIRLQAARVAITAGFRALEVDTEDRLRRLEDRCTEEFDWTPER